ncbi:sigma-70 family RNA polymerase sigma factor [Romboutsia sp. 1001216sp1]|uniref:sigma-70 family RNA polymerase sigma factor n=1 Tax=Romboutsia TaxID=1501226 RepID=UPI000A7B614A|nr:MULTISPECIES: sigma-70 family RNA polymerase sigma factor [Romboutsia]MDB8794181.1 sigma-70 family RNA polymerase sigma factor [Romboutsia sp. 1001216sp1]MDB8797210.1 sigma-70 family RNA polymerase sigma factor [Romboutsia sp. 1001216sp1]MDB8800008.1 sigma-70 family RNA polymerase sigma factor [Romboutsia sp. 1001216sp1]
MLKELKVKRAIRGDEKAFIEIIEDIKDNLYTIAYSYVKNEQDTLDIVQETVYKAYISIDTLKKAKYFDTWITRILINISINTINKNKKVTYLDEQNQIEGTVKEIDIDQKIDVINALDELEERHKKVIELKYFDDLTLNEISNKLGIPIGTTKTYLNRGLKRLRSLVGEENV